METTDGLLGQLGFEPESEQRFGKKTMARLKSEKTKEDSNDRRR